MKTIILFVISFMFWTCMVDGQTLEKKDSLNREFQELLKKYKQEYGEYSLIPDDKKRDLIQEYNKRFNPDSTLTEQYPGASRYYAKRPTFAPYGKFIVAPDTTAKYYLIIKDPLTGTVRK